MDILLWFQELPVWGQVIVSIVGVIAGVNLIGIIVGAIMMAIMGLVLSVGHCLGIPLINKKKKKH